MSAPRSKEYTKLCLDIFLMDVMQLESELERLAWLSPDPTSILTGDVTFAEYEFLLLTERDFKVNCMGKATGLIDEIHSFLADA